MGSTGIGSSSGHAIFVRRPDILVVGLSLDDRKPDEITARIERLRALRAGAALIVCLPDEDTLNRQAPFDAVLRTREHAADDGDGWVEGTLR